MNNYWLNLRSPEKIITSGNKLEITQYFYKIAEQICDYFSKFITDRDDAIQECVLIAWEKLPRYDPTKGKAFNFLTTIMLSQLRQIYRHKKNYEELKRRYNDLRR